MRNTVNYAILGCGNIAKRVAVGISNAKDSTLYSFASRDEEKAKNYSLKFESKTYHSSYEEMLNDENVDVVYICTPNKFHFEQIKMCLNHNKNVICEKPMVKTIRELEELYKLSSEKSLVLMEAHKTVFTPLNKLIKKRIDSNEFGKLISVTCDYSFDFSIYPPQMKDHWVTDSSFGGCSYDIGVYPLAFSNYIAGSKIKDIKFKTLRNDEFVCDFGFESEIEYENGVIGYPNSSWLKTSLNKGNALIKLEKCEIEIPAFWKGDSATIHYKDSLENVKVDMVSDFTGEIEEVTNLILNGQVKSRVMNLEASKEILKVLEKVNEYRN